MTTASNLFPSHIEEALDSYKVVALPKGFSDRLIKKVACQSEAKIDSSDATGWTRLRKNNPWRRGGFVASGIVGVGMVSAAAAAALSLAEIPIKIPIMSDLVERVMPTASAKAEPPEPPMPTIPSNASNEATIEGETKISNSEQAIWRNLKPSQKREVLKARIARNEARIQERRVKHGLPPLTKDQLRKRRMAIRRKLANPESRKPSVRRAFRRAALERSVQRNSGVDRSNTPRSQVDVRSGPTNEISKSDAKVATLVDQPAEEVANTPVNESADSDTAPTEKSNVSTDAQAASDVVTNVPVLQMSPEQRQILRDKIPDAVKSRLKKASPAQRQKILRDLRSKRKELRNRRQARQRLRDIRGRAK